MRTPATKRRSTSPPPTGSTGRRDTQPTPLIRADFALRHAGQLATMLPNAGDPLGRIRDGALAAREGRVVWIGEDRRLEGEVDLDGHLLDAAASAGIADAGFEHHQPLTTMQLDDQ